MNPQELLIQDYTYDLPEEKIAHYPLPQRDASKLLVYQKGQLTQDTYAHIDAHLPRNSLLIFNNTRVLEARILFQKESGGVIEIFCLEPHEQYKGIATALATEGHVEWRCLVGGASKWKRGLVLSNLISVPNGDTVQLNAAYKEKLADHFVISFSWTPSHLSFAEILHLAGAVPLPPYIKRKAEPGDEQRYQTIYAEHQGSVASPTAGLHFTEDIFQRLEGKNIEHDFVTLHVGAGTFKPVKSVSLSEHEMHGEVIDVSLTTLRHLVADRKGPLVAVGTTSLRTLESLYWMGVKLMSGTTDPFTLSQWEPYSLPADVPAKIALTNLIKWLEKNNRPSIEGRTEVLIAPGYRPRIVKGLITNFHQPGSTLLVLVAALIGDDWRKVYQYALENDFRFLSYGDGNLMWM
ncbi:MAG: S-adenosylmethionine:tRNA ribosyltransferase-isomerase [Chitinophagaceae bacterium]|nr:S-adenosylmethionine:tRNA ribosyltransferase-isomerase [Chitinophagaceae bacterium]